MERALEGLVVPSKVYGALGAGRPVRLLADELHVLLAEAERQLTQA